MRPRETEQFRRLLVERLQALYRDVHSDIRESMVRQVIEDEPRDEADESQRVQQRDLGVRLAENDAARAQQVEEALRRLDAGEFGQCVECGSEIDPERLRLLPWTSRCIDCQESVESQARSHRVPTM